MTPEQRFVANLREARRAAGLSQEECAFLSGLHRAQMSLYERGKRLPTTLIVVRLAGTLSVTPNDLLKGITWSPGAFQLGRIVVGEEE